MTEIRRQAHAGPLDDALLPKAAPSRDASPPSGVGRAGCLPC
jgi:hypothetical protein